MSAVAGPQASRKRSLVAAAALMLYAGSGPAGSLIVSVVAARTLDAAIFGAFALIWATIQTFASVGQLSLSFTATRFAAQLAPSDPGAAVQAIVQCARWSGLGGLLVFVALALGSDFIAVHMLGHVELASSLRFAAVVALFIICSAVLSAGLVGLPSTSTVMTLGVMQLLLPPVFGSVGALMGGLQGILLGLALAHAIRLAVGWGLLWQWRRRHAAGSAAQAMDGKSLFNFAAPNLVAGMVTPTVQWLSLATVGSSAAGLHSAAMFAVANNLRNTVGFVYTLLAQLFTVRVNQAVGAKDTAQAKRLIGWNLKLSIGAAAAASLVVLLFGKWALGLFGSDYVAALPVLRLLLIAVVLDAASSAMYQYVVVAGSMWKSLLFIVVPRESCLLLITVMGSATPTEMTLATAHAVAALVGLATTTFVARDGRSMIGPRRVP
jgi:O-antigen/teichoic acid export membrane protein